jgi:hypothetical protein
VTLRDALEKAMSRAGIPSSYISTPADDGHYVHTWQVDAILADPILRTALTEGIALALHEYPGREWVDDGEDHFPDSTWCQEVERQQADAIVRMLTT